jgi:hypothetical protein
VNQTGSSDTTESEVKQTKKTEVGIVRGPRRSGGLGLPDFRFGLILDTFNGDGRPRR